MVTQRGERAAYARYTGSENGSRAKPCVKVFRCITAPGVTACLRRYAEYSFLGRVTIDCQALAVRGVSEYSFLEMPGCLLQAFRAGYDPNV
jgi:hypothetical protein